MQDAVPQTVPILVQPQRGVLSAVMVCGRDWGVPQRCWGTAPGGHRALPY